MLKLVVQEGLARGKEFPLKDGAVLGRLATNDIPLADVHASRTNSRIEHAPDGFYIDDLQSTCGTLVNGRKVQRSRIVAGDLLTIGDTVLKVVDDVMPEGSDEATLQAPPGFVPVATAPPARKPATRSPASGVPLGATPTRPERPVFSTPGLQPAVTPRASEPARASGLPAFGSLPSWAVQAFFAAFLVLVLFASKWVGGRIAAQVYQAPPEAAGK